MPPEWVAYLKGTLEVQSQGNVEIVYFGLMEQFSGMGLGGHLTLRPRGSLAARVWVHTCSLDSPAALANYQARGMQLYKLEAAWPEIPDRTPGPWDGA